MYNFAEFRIIGRIGKITDLGSVTKISIASNYPTRDKQSGAWQDNTHWNTLTLFGEKDRARAASNFAKGDVVHAQGRIRESSYEKNGTTVYGVDLICAQLNKVAKAPEKTGGGDQTDGPLAEDDDEIPY